MYLLLVALTILALLAMWIAVLYSTYKGWGPWLRSRLVEIQSTPATVTDKRDVREYVLSRDFGPRLGSPKEGEDPPQDIVLEPIQWFLSFETDEGRQVEYSVGQSHYEAAAVGDHGRLFWRGELFVRFEPTARSTTIDLSQQE